MEVRRAVAQRLPIGLLSKMADDPEWLVRWEVAQRADEGVLRKLAQDVDEEVRSSARARLESAATPESNHG
jgi:hypothetical protein